MLPAVSCLIPVYNGDRHLAASIDSVLAQDHPPAEIVVVDDGSTDRTYAVARSYGELVRVVRQANAGATAARQRGLDEARGELVEFLDADDLCRPTKLASQLRAFEDHPGADVCVCAAQNFWEPGLEWERDRYASLGKLVIGHGYSTLLARKTVFDRVPLDPALGSSSYTEWFLRVKDAGLGVVVMPDILVDRRMHAGSLTHTRDRIDEFFTLAHRQIAAHRAQAPSTNGSEGVSPAQQ